jgi:hypothetical protein
MRGKSWLNGARLLDIWFSRQPATSPAYGPPDTTTIRMQTFVLTFARAREVYDQLVREKIWSNQAGKAAVARMLRAKGLLTMAPRRVSFGRLADPVPQQDPDYINQRPAGGYGTFDDLTAALGRFNLRVVVAGTVGPVPTGNPRVPAGSSGWEVEVSEVGVYVYDSFDFEGDQYLGCWSDNPDGFSPVMPSEPAVGMEAMIFRPPLFTPVGNRDFREWRTQNRRGGDFLVFSDMKRVPISPPDRFVVV